MTTDNSRADALTEITDRLQALTALKKRTDSMPIMNEWQWLNNLRNRLLAAPPVEQHEAAPAMHIMDTEWPVKQIGIPHPDDPPTIMTAAQPEPQAANERAARVADGLEACDWSGVPIGNKAIIKHAVELLRARASSPNGAGAAITAAIMSGVEEGTSENVFAALSSACVRVRELLKARASAPNRMGEEGVCTTCGGSRVVDDGEITGSGGVEFENGPIKCVKDCPDCNPPAPASAPVGLTEQAIADAVTKWFPDRAYQAPFFARALLEGAKQ
ncbi:TPA: hypothetical protein QDC06_004565 [Burkholderia cepacia]|nr:hypothetical protein BZY94_30935 [Burkholderia territorii]HDR9501269.1 hypothetical protein [Burkholderia cepacia]